MTEFGYYEQPEAAVVTIGSFQCKIHFHNATMIQCHAVYGAMYQPLAVRVAVHGAG